LGPGNPGPFYQHVGFSPTGDVNIDGEIIVALEALSAVSGYKEMVWSPGRLVERA
jgi:hypothetical protein